jgi:membrane-associated protein
MSDFLLTQIINYGAPFIGVVVFISALGAPFPCTLIVVAAGAFARQGLLTWYSTGLIAVTFVVLGDNLSYGLGHFAREPVLRRFKDSERWKQAEDTFNRWGGMSIFWTRFLLTGIAVPVNLIAGTGGFGARRFFVYDLIGETIWIFGYGSLGYLFGSQWELVSDVLSNISGLTLGLVILVIGTWLGVRRFRKNNNASSSQTSNTTGIQ